jgi:N-acylneuraminate cytidylyltransferase
MPYGSPIQRALKQEAKKVSFFYPEFSLSRSQDLEKSFHDAGQFYWMNTVVCLEKKQILTDNSGSIVVSELEGQDIDNEVDWKLAELKYELLQSIK